MEITAPVNRVTVVPCQSNEAVAWVEAATGAASLSKLPANETTNGVYAENCPLTEEQKSLAFILSVE